MAVFEVNDRVTALASNNPICTSRTKHVNVWMHIFVLEKVGKNIMNISHVTSACRSSVDSLTMNLPAVTRKTHDDKKFVEQVVGLE